MRLFILTCVLVGLCFGVASAQQQGGPGYLDPQRVVSSALSAACAGGSGCPANTVAQQTTATGYSVCSGAVSGTFSATVTFEQSADGINWFGAYLTPNSGGAAVNTASGSFFGTITLYGATWFRIRMSAYTSGTATATTYCAPATLPFGASRT